MLAIKTGFVLLDFVNTFISLLAAFLLGSLIGIEREYRRQVAGLRTNALVAVGAAIFVDIAMRGAGSDGGIRVAAAVVSGVGFLGAGAILRDSSGSSIRGLNTAATLWSSAAVGACAGADLIAEAALGTFFILLANSTLRIFENKISRQPINTLQDELHHVVHLIANKDNQEQAVRILDALLKEKNITLHEIQTKAFTEDSIEIVASLDIKSVSADEIAQFIKALNQSSMIEHAFWLPRAH